MIGFNGANRNIKKRRKKYIHAAIESSTSRRPQDVPELKFACLFKLNTNERQ